MKDISKSNDDHVWVWKEKTVWKEIMVWKEKTVWTGKTVVKCVEKWVSRDTSNLSGTELL